MHGMFTKIVIKVCSAHKISNLQCPVALEEQKIKRSTCTMREGLPIYLYFFVQVRCQFAFFGG